jgi:tripartite-type tricarboxylate transporter receptor subunit TctC
MVMKNKIFALLLFAASLAHAQRNVEFVIPFAQGGTADRLALSLIGPMREELAPYNINPVLIYKPGGGSTLATSSVAQADKLQILMAPNAIITAAIVNPSAANYNLEIDLVPLEYIGHISMLLVVNANSNIHTVRDLQRECKTRPITFGSAGIGSATHISSSIALTALRCPSIHVPYKGVGPALADLQGKHIDVVTDFVTSVRPYIDAKAFRPLLSVDRNQNPEFSHLPTMLNIGNNDYDFYNWFVLAVNSSAPKDDIAQVRRALHNMMSRADVRKQMHEAGLRDIGKTIPRSFLIQEYRKFKKIINRINVDAK